MIEIIDSVFLSGWWQLDWFDSTEPGEEEQGMIEQLFAQMIGLA